MTPTEGRGEQGVRGRAAVPVRAATASLARLRTAASARSREDRGLATVWVAMTTATLCAVFAVVLALGQVVVVRHRAGGAADLAALAAADRALRGPAEACEAAGRVAAAQGATVVRCSVSGEIADVTARVAFGRYAPEVRSRAGPPAAGPGGPGSVGPPAAGHVIPGPAGPPAAGPGAPGASAPAGPLPASRGPGERTAGVR
ncbi:Rv3654c family TadE-like protein [Streptomyces sp. NPDC092952]|uniref:Rv3654c family TadE-like protein n=1 Tax=Streptomyces sp. NPDC092952 TaxID=3366018 RepID=UPI00381E947D